MAKKKISQKFEMSISSFIRIVLAHYREAGRHTLPWRKTRDPYRVMVSETMLQQTQVRRVIPYYRDFLRKFPSVRALAQAPLSEVLKAWSGLGYNRRAKMLHDAAKAVVAHHGGVMPRDREELEALPGVGVYTAGAVRAFALDAPEVLIETNIRTVLIHHFFPRGRSVSDRRLLPILEACIAAVESPREWYAALMDYGTHLKSLHPNPSRKSKHHVRQSRFEGSLRQVRGALLKAYTNDEPFDVVQERFPDRFETALMSLKREGLIG